MSATDQRTNPARRIRGKTPAERREQRRRAVLDTALRLFVERGFTGTSIEQLCQESFVSTRSFYDLFRGREDCYKELYAEVAGAVMEEVTAGVARTAGGEAAATEALVVGFVGAAFREPLRAQVLWGSGRAVTPDVEVMRRETRERAASFLDGVWQRHGVPGDNHAIAVALIGGVFDLMAVWLIDGDPSDADQVAALTAQLGRFYRAVRRGLDA